MDPDSQRLLPLLGGLVDHERRRPRKGSFDLKTIRALLDRPGAATLTMPAVQVAGSKGKGTTCLLLEAIARGAGLRPGTYTSPHLETPRERIRVDGRPVGVDELVAALEPILAFAGARGLPATFFEVMTAAAVEVFAAAGVDLAIFEVGLGGRYDATTAVPVQASIVTSIELEHTDLLGDTIEAIAAEKAQVIRPQALALTATAEPALSILQARAAEVGARLLVAGRDFAITGDFGADGALAGHLRLPGRDAVPFWLPEARAFEKPALALAAATLAELFPALPLPLCPAPRPEAAGRFELRAEADGALLVLDGAHTPASLAAVAGELRRRCPDQRAAVLFAAAAGKRWRQGLSELLEVADSFLVTGLTGTAGEDPATIAAWLRGRGARCTVVADPASGLLALRRFRGPRLVTGSFYLVAAVRRALAEEDSGR